MAMKLLPYEIFKKMRSAKSKSKCIEILKENESWALKDLIRGAMDSTIQWNLPEGEPPYTPSLAHSAASSILKEHKRFGYFAKGGPGDKLPAFKRENIFISILEAIHPEDAKIVADMVNKKVQKPITRPMVNEAFPGLLKD